MKTFTAITEGLAPSPASAAAHPRVYVIQQQVLVAKALCNILQQDPSITVVGDGATVAESDLARSAPNLILLDSETSFDALSNSIGTCRLACPRARIGVLSEHLINGISWSRFSIVPLS